MTTESDARHAIARANEQRDLLRMHDTTPAPARTPAVDLSPDELEQVERFGLDWPSVSGQGWVYPGFMYRAHYFIEGEFWSLCGQAYVRAEDGDRDPDDTYRTAEQCLWCHEKKTALAVSL